MNLRHVIAVEVKDEVCVKLCLYICFCNFL